MSDFLTVAEVAAKMGFKYPDTVYDWIKAGELAAVNVAASRDLRPTWRVAVADFKAFVESRRVVPVQRPARVARRRIPRPTIEYV